MKRWLQFAISLAVGGLVLRAVLRQFDFSQMSSALRQAHPSLLLLGLALMIAAYLLRGARWRIWESSLSYWDSLRLILIGFMGNNVFPARLGEILRAHCALGQDAQRLRPHVRPGVDCSGTHSGWPRSGCVRDRRYGAGASRKAPALVAVPGFPGFCRGRVGAGSEHPLA